MNILVSLATLAEEDLVCRVANGLAGAECKVSRSLEQTLGMLAGWVPDVVFVDPALVLDGPFSMARAQSADSFGGGATFRAFPLRATYAC